MVSVIRLFILLPLCLLGLLPECGRGSDVFSSLGALAEGQGEARQVTALVDMPPHLEESNDADAAPATPERSPTVFSELPAGTIPMQAYGTPDVQFESMPSAFMGETYPMGPEEVWEDSGWATIQPGIFARQPLRQHLRAMYGPPQGRHRGLGQPHTNESWLFRPYSAGWFMGAVFGSPLIDDWLGIGSGYFTGLRFGWDQNYYWGLEMQFGYGQMGLWDSGVAKADRREWYVDQGWSADDPALGRLINARRDLDAYQWAVSVMYYPWGDSRWRPYFSVGVGASRMKFTDIFLAEYDKTFFVLPLAIGLKFHWNDWLALRFECADSFSVPGGGGLKPIHNFSVNGALEIRFGGPRTAYWPWNPGRTYW